jgi:chemotaxis signal transduction protein
VSKFVRGIIAMEGRMISLIGLDEILPEEEAAEAA